MPNYDTDKRRDNDVTIPRLYKKSFQNIDFITNYFLRNEACIFSPEFTDDWLARKEWANLEGAPNLENLRSQYGHAIVPVQLGGDRCYQNIPFGEFIDRFCKDRHQGFPVYLKDWHFQRSFCDKQELYAPPAPLLSDWINSESWTFTEANPFEGDYKFVYFGTKGSWTPFHADVMNSFSWTANICGRKYWYLLRPGGEIHFSKAKNVFVDDIRLHKNVFALAGVMEFIQNAGEIVFVPSGWYHQVHNLDDTISINHNVINSFNIARLLRLVESRLEEVENEIFDIRHLCTVNEFSEQCQNILRLDLRINLPSLIQLAGQIFADRKPRLPISETENGEECWSCLRHGTNIFCCEGDEECINFIDKWLSKRCECIGVRNLCSHCSEFMYRYELTWAKLIDSFCTKLLQPKL